MNSNGNTAIEGKTASLTTEEAFVGYSGIARAVGGVIALVGAAVIGEQGMAHNYRFHEYAWAGIILAMLLVNYGALAFRYFSTPRRTATILKPAIDAAPGLIAAMIGTMAFANFGSYIHVFGFWLLVFGVANAAHRIRYSDGIWTLGMFYILCGALMMLEFPTQFDNPWPVAAALGIGEIWGGGIFMTRDRAAKR